jgi:hypothetical protein
MQLVPLHPGLVRAVRLGGYDDKGVFDEAPAATAAVLSRKQEEQEEQEEQEDEVPPQQPQPQCLAVLSWDLGGGCTSRKQMRDPYIS